MPYQETIDTELKYPETAPFLSQIFEGELSPVKGMRKLHVMVSDRQRRGVHVLCQGLVQLGEM